MIEEDNNEMRCFSGTTIDGIFLDQSASFSNGVAFGIVFQKLKSRELLEKETIPAAILSECLRFAVLSKYRFENITIFNNDYFVVDFLPLQDI